MIVTLSGRSAADLPAVGVILPRDLELCSGISQHHRQLSLIQRHGAPSGSIYHVVCILSS